MKNPEKSGKNGLKSKLPTFEGLNEKQLGALYNRAPIKKLKRGDYLIREGESDQTVYVILDGVVKIVKNIRGRSEEIASLGQGDWVGEIALTRKIKRTASALAQTETSVMVMDYSVLDALDSETQLFFFKKFNDLAAKRVSELSAREMELTSQNLQLVDYIQASRGRGRLDYSSSEMIRGIVGKAPKLPSFARSLLDLLLNEEAGTGELAERIKEDQALVSLVLKIVNSKVYGFKKKIDDIHHTIALLGLHEVYLAVLAEGIRRTMPDSPTYREILTHSTAVSRLAFLISQETNLARPPEAAAIALLHELGSGVIQLLKEKNPALVMLIESLDSAQIGALLLREWDLPENVSRAAAHQFDPEFSPPNLTPDDVRPQATLLYLSHLALDYMKDRPLEEAPTAFFNDYIRLCGWNGLSLSEIVDGRLLPKLMKKSSTFPADFRKLLKKNKKAETEEA